MQSAKTKGVGRHIEHFPIQAQAYYSRGTAECQEVELLAHTSTARSNKFRTVFLHYSSLAEVSVSSRSCLVSALIGNKHQVVDKPDM